MMVYTKYFFLCYQIWIFVLFILQVFVSVRYEIHTTCVVYSESISHIAKNCFKAFTNGLHGLYMA